MKKPTRSISLLRFVVVVMCVAVLCGTVPLAATQSGTAYAGHKHTFFNPKTYQQTTVTRIKAVGKPVYGGWATVSKSQKVQFGGSAVTIRGKSYTVTKTASVTLTGTLSASATSALKGQIEAKAGVTKEWKKQKYSARAVNSARNKTNVNRWIAYCARSKYQIYEVTYSINKVSVKHCTTCGKNFKTVKYLGSRKGYIAKKTGMDSAYFYSNSGSAFTKKKAATFSTRVNGVTVKYEAGKNYLSKNNKVIVGGATKYNQNFNAFSNIKYWK